MTEYARTKTLLGKALGVSLNSVNYYIRRRGAPWTKTKKGYNVDEARAWVERNIRQNVLSLGTNGSGEDTDDDLDDASYTDLKKRLLRAQVYEKEQAGELKELKLKIQRGEFVPLEEVKRRDLERISVVKTGLSSLPRRLAQEMEGLNTNQREVMLKTRFRELLERFSRM